jgi:hypothetical protein
MIGPPGAKPQGDVDLQLRCGGGSPIITLSPSSPDNMALRLWPRVTPRLSDGTLDPLGRMVSPDGNQIFTFMVFNDFAGCLRMN